MDRGKNKRFILVPFLLAGALLWLVLSNTAAYAGSGDGDATNYLDNGNFENPIPFWVLEGAGSSIVTCDSPNKCLDLTNGTAEQQKFLPAGTANFTLRYWRYASSGFRIRLFNATTGVQEGFQLVFSSGPGWTNGSGSIDISASGYYTIQLEDLSLGSWVDDIVMTVNGSGPELTEPPPVTGILTATCVITVTGGLTQTVAANLLENYSFEVSSNNVVPDSWEIVSGGDVAAAVYQDGALAAFDGSKYLKINDEQTSYILKQNIAIPLGVSYTVGAMLNYFSTVPTGTVRFGLSYQTVVYTDTSSTFYVSNGYKPVFIEYDNLAGATEFYIEIPPQDAIFINSVDKAFIIPTDSEGGVSCATVQEWYNGGGNSGNNTPPGEYAPIQNVFGLPVPLAGAGEVCYTCYFPTDRGVEAAIAWLGCVIRNMFSCSLRRWLKELLNVSLSAFAAIPLLVNFMNANLQPFINWLGVFMQASLDLYATGAGLVAGGTFTPGSNLYDLLIALLGTPAEIINALAGLINSITGLLFGAVAVITTIVNLIVSLLTALVSPLIAIIQLIFDAIGALWGALSAPPLGIQDFVNNGASPDVNIADELAADGINDSKVFTMIMWGMAVMDAFVLDFSAKPLVYFATGMVGIGTIYWLLKKWDVITPY